MRYSLYLLLSVFLFLGLKSELFGQENDCSTRLRQAQSQFEMGQIEQIPDLLNECLQSGFSREEKILAYKLLINSYIFDNNLPQAEVYMLEFMRKYPEYEIVNTDPSEFVNLLREFNNNPRGSIGFGGGINVSKIRVIEPYGIHSQVGIDDGIVGLGEYKSAGSGFQAGLSYNINLSPGFEIGLEPQIIQNTYEYNNHPYDFSYVEFREDQLRIDLPISFIYVFQSKGKINPYVRLGVKASYLISAKSDSRRLYENTDDVVFENVKGPKVEINDSRELMNYWALFGGGFRYKIPRAYFFVDLRYNMGLKNQVNPASRNNGMDENTWLYYYNQDDFLLDDISFSVGVSKILYKPKRK